MSQIKLYKKFYTVSIIRTGSTVDQNYVLLDPYALSANTYIASTGDTESTTLIESTLPILQEGTGVYFANLNPFLYSSDITYDLVWFVSYFNNIPIKKLNTRFRINVNTYTNQIEVEYINAPLEVELLNSTLEIEILGKN